jgi:hypothetical protein
MNIIELKLDLPHNVCISRGELEVVVSDEATCTYSEDNRLSSATLSSIMCNILAMTNAKYAAVSTAQRYDYEGRTEYKAEIVEVNQMTAMLTVDNDQICDSYTIDLRIVKGSLDDLYNIFNY